MRNFHIIAGVEVISGRNLEFFVFVEISRKKVTCGGCNRHLLRVDSDLKNPVKGTSFKFVTADRARR